MTILGHPSADIDWTRLVEQSKKRHATFTMATALSYLVGAFDAPVPTAVLGALRASPTSRRERVALRNRSRRTTTSALLGDFPNTLNRYREYSAAWSLPKAIARLPFYLQHVWKLDHLRQVPGVAVKKFASKAAATLRADEKVPSR
jgi:hypothetical protein